MSEIPTSYWIVVAFFVGAFFGLAMGVIAGRAAGEDGE